MKRVLIAAAVAGGVFSSVSAHADTVAYLASQGFQIQHVVRYGIDGEREIYLQRDDALFVCWIQVVANERRVVEQGCRQISPTVQ